MTILKDIQVVNFFILCHEIALLLFFHYHLEFSSTFLMLTSNKNIDKKESLQNKAIRLLIGLPRISHTAEAF